MTEVGVAEYERISIVGDAHLRLTPGMRAPNEWTMDVNVCVDTVFSIVGILRNGSNSPGGGVGAS